MDLTVSVDALPDPGATLLGREYEASPGGKGANQAVAAGRLGAPASMFGRIGRDEYGRALESSLLDNGVRLDALRRETGAPTGLALITVERSGQNTIVVVPGANWGLTPSDIRSARPLISDAGMLLLQQEIPPETVEAAISVGAESGTPVLVNPAPARSISAEALRGVHYLLPNETEALELAGMTDEAGEWADNHDSVAEAARRLRRRGAANIVITLGDRGAYASIDDDEHWVPAFPVRAVDATAAGDAFVAGFGTRLLAGTGPLDALRFAAAAGALTATRPGAQKSLPDRAEVERFLATQG